MQTLKFHTNINCGGCLAKVTPFLNEAYEAGNWEVDFLNPNKPLVVRGEDLIANEIVATVAEAGFKAELVQMEA
ncbi:MAG: heavy-metal-associated domain-containing protein [Bacteroidota bacterium]|nr:heavy-metal-associated domain-containing protein [Bacteroidota bacterium]MDX5431043.1 heavy-metal-associated domain-containing protein [Bacteroidota bacterium]MDX5469797.1 heavy-metal-associated domain-containing protein [Bacteroidota bacterium]